MNCLQSGGFYGSNVTNNVAYLTYYIRASHAKFERLRLSFPDTGATATSQARCWLCELLVLRPDNIGLCSSTPHFIFSPSGNHYNYFDISSNKNKNGEPPQCKKLID